MSKTSNPFDYCRISVKEEHEVDMVGFLMDSGHKFSAISETDYLISNAQCEILTENGIPYKKL